jgi:predicted secreted Zn-dependent protease
MKRAILLLAVLAAVLSISCAGLIQASPPPFVFSEPEVFRYETSRLDNVSLIVNVWERTYAVPGTTTSEVAENLASLRRAGSGHGPYSASTKWDFQIGMRYADEPGGCRLAAATVEIIAVITLPALESPEALLAWERVRWDNFIANLEGHELEHLANEIEGAHRLQSALLALPTLETCGAVGDAANRLVAIEERATVEADARLDAETKHGALTGATFP